MISSTNKNLAMPFIIFIAECLFKVHVGGSFEITLRCTISEHFIGLEDLRYVAYADISLNIEVIIIFYDFKEFCF